MIDFQPEDTSLDFQLDFQPEDQGFSLSRGLANAYDQATMGADAALSLPAGALQQLVTGESTVFDEWKAREKAYQERIKSRGTGGIAEKSLGVVGTFPLQLLAMPGAPAQTAETFIDAGESPTRAAIATGLETASNVAGLSPLLGASSVPVRAAIGSSVNVSLGAGTDATKQLIAEKEETKAQFDPYDVDRRLVEGLTGGILQGTMGERPATKSRNIEGALDEIIAKEPTKETQLDFKVDESIQPDLFASKNPYDIGGFVTDLKNGVETTIDSPQQALFGRELGLPEKAPEEVKTQFLKKVVDEQAPVVEAPEKLGFGDGPDFRIGNTKISGMGLPEAYKFSHAIKSVQDINGKTMHLLDLPETLSTISKDSSAPKDLRVIANLLNENYIKPYKDKVFAEIGQDGIPTRTVKSGAKDVHAYYNGNVPGGDVYKFGLSGLKSSTIVHEVLHGATVKLMRANSKSKPVRNLVRIWEHASKQAEVFQAQGQYGFKDVYEMISEAFTNPDFQKVLQKIELPYDMRVKNVMRNVWDNIKYLISQVLSGKLSPKEEIVSALDGVLHHTAELLDAYDPTQKMDMAALLKERADKLAPEDILRREAFDLSRPSSIERLNKSVALAVTAMSDNINGPKKLIEKAESFKPEPTPQEVVKGPLSKELNSFVSPDPLPEKVISDALKETDSNLKFGWAQSGSILTGLKTNSSLIQGVGRLILNANKRASLNTDAFVKPVERTFNKIFRSEALQELASIFKKEMFSNHRFTADELRSIGVSEKQIEAHQQMRGMFDKVLEIQNKALVSRGEAPISPKEAYLSSRWQGRFRIPVYEGNRLVWYIAESSKKNALAALDYLKKNGVVVNEQLSKLEYKGIGYKDSNPVGAYRTILNLLGPDDPRVGVLKSIMEDAAMKDAYSTFGQSKHFENKSNIRGFIGDQPWKPVMENAQEMFKQQFEYAKNALEWAELNNTMQKVAPILEHEQLNIAQPNNMKYAKAYVKEKLGFGETKVVAALESAIGEMVGKDPNNLRKSIGSLKGLYYTWTFGLNIPFAVMSTMQGAFSAPWHAVLSNKGYSYNPATTMVKSIQDASAVVLQHEAHNRGKSIDVPMTKVGKEALTYAEANGIIERNMFDEARALGRNPYVQGAQNVMNITITLPEKIARAMSFMSFVHHLEESGKFPKTPEGRTMLFQLAEEHTLATMADYRRGERPMMFSKLGILGDSVATLRTFMFNYYNQLHTFAKMAHKGEYSPLVTFLGVQAILGGVVSLPFLSEAEKTWEGLKKLFSPYLPVEVFEKVKDTNIRKTLVTNLPDWASYGAVSKLTGVDFSSRMNSPNFVPSADWASVFPFAVPDIREAKSIVDFAKDPNLTTAQQIAYAHVPNGLQGAVETVAPAFKTGRVTQEGTDYVNPKDVTKFGATRSPTEEVIRAMGARSLKEAHRKDLLFRESEIEMLIKDKQDEVKDKFNRAFLRGDSAAVEDHLKDYIRLDGDMETLLGQVETILLRSRVPQEVLVQMRAQSGKLSDVQKMQRYEQLFKSYREQYK